MWIGHNVERKGWTQWEGKEGTESERDGPGERKDNGERWRK